MNSIAERLKNVFIVVVVTTLLLWAVEGFLIDKVSVWRGNAPYLQSREAPDWIQQISQEVATSLGLPRMRIVDVPGKGMQARAALEIDPPVITVNMKVFGDVDREVVKTVIVHEYGHLLQKKEGNPTPVVLYLLGTFLLLITLLVTFLFVTRKLSWTLWLAFSSAILGLIVATNKIQTVLANEAMLLLPIAGLILIAVDKLLAAEVGKREVKTISIGFLVGFALFYLGIELRNHFFRADETSSDAVALRIRGSEATRRMLCTLIAENDKLYLQKRDNFRKFNEWYAIHPMGEKRAAAIGLKTTCTDVPNLPRSVSP